ncbi:hypothetical protein [Gordonia sp. OPL2]|uniref:hypothetical protein n=1 Tax=Gordonia sp. OPL2 TaxID=2486274 RepID=UPI001654CA79|nr:hypothetical protein [Gordonia sp. OPL2]RPA12619.1 hypothetical protein EEB19_05050 [Gordonia sp. OPL2]
MTAAAETLVTHAWDLWEQEPEADHADLLRDAVWRLEEATDLGHDDVPKLAREVVYALTLCTGDERDEILAPMPGVASWLGFDR